MKLKYIFILIFIFYSHYAFSKQPQRQTSDIVEAMSRGAIDLDKQQKYFENLQIEYNESLLNRIEKLESQLSQQKRIIKTYDQIVLKLKKELMEVKDNVKK